MFLILYNNIVVVVIIIIFFTVLFEIYNTLKCVYKSILDVIYSHYYF